MRPALIGLAIVTALVIGRCSAPAPQGLPPAVQAAVDRHEAAIVVDTATVNRLEREKADAHRRELAAAAGRQRAEDSAATHRRRADSLEAAAHAAQTSADSLAMWQQAYYARSGEAEDLRLALGDAKAEAREVREQLAAADSSGAVWRSRALRADSVIAELKPLATDSRWGLGAAIGVGCGASGCGPQLTVGAVYRVRIPNPRRRYWLGGT